MRYAGTGSLGLLLLGSLCARTSARLKKTRREVLYGHVFYNETAADLPPSLALLDRVEAQLGGDIDDNTYPENEWEQFMISHSLDDGMSNKPTNSTGEAQLYQRFMLEDSTKLGAKGLCVLGCSPYVDMLDTTSGIAKYNALVLDMAKSCDIVVHAGDTKPGNMACNRDVMTMAVHLLTKKAKKKNVIALYAPGDNEIVDCFRHQSFSDPNKRVPTEISRSQDARDYIVQDLDLGSDTDLTGKYLVTNHIKQGTIPGTSVSYSCDFDKYVELDYYAVATLEVLGSFLYLADERKKGYPLQDEVDPLSDRLSMFLNANECALEWIEQSADRAEASGKRALFFVFHATFYEASGSRAKPQAAGDYYNPSNLKSKTGDKYDSAYKSLFDKLTEVAKNHYRLMIYCIHSDGHRTQTIRMNPTLNNGGEDSMYSYHNLMLHQTEGASRALTMWSRFTVNPNKFQPISFTEEWSSRAYFREPVGHSWTPYSPY